MRLENAREIDRLQQEFDRIEYLATGSEPLQRVFNSAHPSVIDLIAELAIEAFPSDWRCEATVEEFTNTLLMVEAPSDSTATIWRQTETALRRLSVHAGFYLKNVALYDRRHVCLFFLDESALHELETQGHVSAATRDRCLALGRGFTRFNAIRIAGDVRNGQMFVPLTVLTDNGYYELDALVDSGASITLIGRSLATQTGNEPLSALRRQRFKTVGGEVQFPLVVRTIRLGQITKDLQVAVADDDQQPLLGIDFFDGYHYRLDFAEACIYVWGDVD